MTTAVAAVLVGTFLLLMALEVPIAICLGVAALVTTGAFRISPLSVLPQQFFAAMDSFTLLAIPLFILAGTILGRSGISRRLIRLASVIVGDLPGGLGIAGVIASIFFAGISGSGPADTAALGLILIPAMVQSGYQSGFASALMAAGGGLGIIVPPSIALVIFGAVTETSIPKLFMAGIVPGVLMGAALAMYTWTRGKRQGYKGLTRRGSPAEILKALREAAWAILTPVIILGGIYSGIFTPTESAAVAVIYAVLVDVVVYREMGWRDLWECLRSAGVTSATVLVIVACASAFARVLTQTGISQELTAGIINFSPNRVVMLLLVNALLIIMGCFMDAVSILYVLMPVLMPAVKHFGVDPVHFGIITVMNLAIGQITPPVGVNLFAASAVSNVPVATIVRSVVPIIVIETAVLLLVTYIPALALMFA